MNFHKSGKIRNAFPPINLSFFLLKALEKVSPIPYKAKIYPVSGKKFLKNGFKGFLTMISR